MMQKIKENPFAHILIISLILFIFGWITISPLTFSTSDVGLRFIQIRSLITERWQTFAIAYPTDIDPDVRHSPYYYAYSLVDGRLYFNISPFYPLIASWLFAVVGTVGLVISPILGTLLIVWGAWKLAKNGRLPYPTLYLWTTVFASPILFYSVQVWDHTLGTGLAFLGIAFALDGRQTARQWPLVVGGILLGLSVGQRQELYLFVWAFGLAWLTVLWGRWRETAVLILGGLIGVLPIWILQFIWFGHPLGMSTAPHLLGYGRPETFPMQSVGLPRAIVAGNFLFHIEGRDAITFSASMATVVGIGVLFFALRVPNFRKRAFLWTGTILIVLGQLVWSRLALTNMVTGLISTFALFGFSIIIVGESAENRDTHPIYRFILLTTTIYIIGMLLLWPSFGARVWGSRYLLTAYPLLTFLAFYNLKAYGSKLTGAYKTAVQSAFMVLLITAVGLQLMGIRFNHKIVQELATDRDVVAASAADVFMTNQPFWPALMASVDNKLFLYVSKDADIEKFIPLLHEKGLDNISVVFLESAQLAFPEQVDNIIVTHPKPFFYVLDDVGD